MVIARRSNISKPNFYYDVYHDLKIIIAYDLSDNEGGPSLTNSIKIAATMIEQDERIDITEFKFAYCDTMGNYNRVLFQKEIIGSGTVGEIVGADFKPIAIGRHIRNDAEALEGLKKSEHSNDTAMGK